MSVRKPNIATHWPPSTDVWVESGTTIDDPTSPLSPISPWPPVPSPPRRRGSKRRQSSSHSKSSGSPHAFSSLALHAAVDDALEEEGEEEDANDIDGTNQGETLPSAPEVYGALAVLLTYIAFSVYLIWAVAPEGWLDKWGWTWYPDREWSIVVPCYLMLIVLLTYLSYAALTAWNTPAFDSMTLITDKYANIPPITPGEKPYYHRFAAVDAIPEAVDLPIDLVCRVLYPPRKRTDR